MREKVLDAPFQVAVSSDEPLALIAAGALAVKPALDAPAPIVTDGGTVTAAFPLDRVTVVALVAALLKLTVQAELPGGVKVSGVHVKLKSPGEVDVFRVRVAV